jgi:hypothetical protein
MGTRALRLLTWEEAPQRESAPHSRGRQTQKTPLAWVRAQVLHPAVVTKPWVQLRPRGHGSGPSASCPQRAPQRATARLPQPLLRQRPCRSEPALSDRAPLVFVATHWGGCRRRSPPEAWVTAGS